MGIVVEEKRTTDCYEFTFFRVLNVANTAETAELVEFFKKIGHTQFKAAETAKNPKNAATLRAIADGHKLTDQPPDEGLAVLLATLTVQSAKLGEAERKYAIGVVSDGRLKSTDQVSGEWLGKSATSEAERVLKREATPSFANCT
ncbi:uncharacterized protein BXZ73DRAFT_102780 [Epithele typhae]|uniref:uncharacterized protein n=1 Tax=Epithele typhae TaxID=378194 RepID=UPI002008C54E|nr:uncharacterized protein BXZ73DRAFT_102780 [Epithele typhae]KAH9927193.1 hypothetical protein BXZ73DRAFT_102780 [Epithele typhae]